MTSTISIKDAATIIREGERSQLIELVETATSMKNEWLKRQIIQNNRIDLLATEVLGYQCKPFHLAIMRWQFLHKDNLQLCFRGAGKSTVGTVTKAIHCLLKNRDLRIVIASRTMTQSEGFLKEIKGHFEGNAKLQELFGEFYDPHRVTKWDNREIEILGRTKATKEATITCIGVDGAVVGKHYDVEFSDDLIDEDNSRTKLQRDKTRTWYYQTLEPCMEPPDPTVPCRGERHRLGTRYHFDDLYGHWINNEMKDHHQIIPALSPDGLSPWPEKFTPEFLLEKKAKSGMIIFNAQYQCDTEAMKGEVFRYDDCQIISDEEIPKGLRKYVGVDLAISEKEAADKFAIVAIGLDPITQNIYVLDFFDGQLRFSEQTKKIIEFYKKHDPVRLVVEKNAYQLAQLQTLEDFDKNMRVKGVETDKDKMTRAMKLSPTFEQKRVFFRKNMGPLIDQLVLFPGFRYKDLFDALDLAVTASRMKSKKRIRASEPGLI